ncbi:MAG: metallophosphoesterase, partial [Bacteroidetes bacterium]|nr:metallophosphoesterase [Bacteroidota bacterium]
MLLPIIILLAIDLYAFQAVRTVLIDSPTFKLILTVAYWMISIALYIGAIAIMQREFNTTTLAIRIVFGAIITFAVAKLFIVLFLLAEDSVRLVKWAVHQLYTQPITGVKQHGITRSQFISKMGLLAGGFMLGSFVWGMVKTAYNYKIRKVRIPLAQLKSSFKGLKIIQISDLHLGSFIGTEAIEHAVRIINEQQADVIFFTGDLVNAHAMEAEPFIPVLSQLQAKYGVYSTLGNHDYYGTEADLARIK